jgi:hypothetical protein
MNGSFRIIPDIVNLSFLKIGVTILLDHYIVRTSKPIGMLEIKPCTIIGRSCDTVRDLPEQ